ncbi:uncharacterized protein LOC111829390 isoform X2 [Capsella rubella]|nr:uncharacterized protein LOC111829390 isoform X2 [Capsella rubella]
MMLKSDLPGPCPTYRSLLPEKKNRWFRGFSQEFHWDVSINEHVWTKNMKQADKAWMKARKRLFDGYIKMWTYENKIKQAEKNSKNRGSQRGGLGVAKHNNGAKTFQRRWDELVVSDKLKERKKKQIPHTCSRKGMVRLREEMKMKIPEPSKVSRLKFWVKSRTPKDGTPVNTNAAEKIKKAAEVDTGAHSSPTDNPKGDLVAQVLGADNLGQLRVMGRGMSMSKFSCFQVNNECMDHMQEKHF